MNTDLVLRLHSKNLHCKIKCDVQMHKRNRFKYMANHFFVPAGVRTDFLSLYVILDNFVLFEIIGT